MPNKYSSKYTYDEVKSDFLKCDYELLTEEYINSTQILEYICNKHKDKGVLTTTYSNIKRGRRCRFCVFETRWIHTDEIKKHCDKLNLQFINSHTKNGSTCIDYICSKHQDKGIQTTSWENFKNATIGCKYCCGKNKTTEDFIFELHNINANIVVLGQYISAKSKIKCKCTIDDYEWCATPNDLLRGTGCPLCGLKISKVSKLKSNEQVMKELEYTNQNIEILSEYTGVFDTLKCRCIIDGFEWESSANSLLHHKSKCPLCLSLQRHETAKSNDQFLKELELSNPDIMPLEEYFNENTKIKCKCLIHDYEWYAIPSHLLYRNTGCPKCSKYTN